MIDLLVDDKVNDGEKLMTEVGDGDDIGNNGGMSIEEEKKGEV